MPNLDNYMSVVADRSSALRDGLDTHAQLQRNIAVLRAQAEKEK